MKAYQKTALRVAGIFFGIWLLLALAIADFRQLVLIVAKVFAIQAMASKI